MYRHPDLEILVSGAPVCGCIGFQVYRNFNVSVNECIGIREYQHLGVSVSGYIGIHEYQHPVVSSSGCISIRVYWHLSRVYWHLRSREYQQPGVFTQRHPSVSRVGHDD